MTTYVILGATGKVGTATSLALRNTGVHVRAIVRDGSNTTTLLSLGCEIATANLQDADSIARAIDGADAVQVVLPPFAEAQDPHGDMKNAIETLANALERTKPRRILAISDYGAHVSHDIGMPTVFHSLEKRFGQLHGHKLFLRSAEHMENWARIVPVARVSATLPSFSSSLEEPIPTIAARDVGGISAQLLLLPFTTDGVQVVHAEGPRRYSIRDVAKAFTELLGKPIEAESIPRSQWDRVFENNLAPSLAELLIKANEAQNEGDMIDVEPGSDEIQYGGTELKDALQALISPGESLTVHQ